MSNNTILKALSGWDTRRKMIRHSFRWLASTILYEQGKLYDHIELQLA